MYKIYYYSTICIIEVFAHVYCYIIMLCYRPFRFKSGTEPAIEVETLNSSY